MKSAARSPIITGVADERRQLRGHLVVCVTRLVHTYFFAHCREWFASAERRGKSDSSKRNVRRKPTWDGPKR